MLEELNAMLRDLRSELHLEVAAISADGNLIAGDFESGHDANRIAAAAGDGFLMMAAMGGLINRGEEMLLSIEYDNGALVVSPLEPGAVLVMVAGVMADIGMLRVAARRFQAQYLQATTLVA